MLNVDKNHLEIISKILKKHFSEYEIWAFGSRVNGNPKKHSDLDLAIIGKDSIPILTMALAKEDFSKSDLPYKIDLVDWNLINNDFKKIIRGNYEKILPENKRLSEECEKLDTKFEQKLADENL